MLVWAELVPNLATIGPDNFQIMNDCRHSGPQGWCQTEIRIWRKTMSIITGHTHFADAQIIDMIKKERAKALSRREWKHRLAGFGYGIRETTMGDVVETLPHRVEL
jgi:hypothetical protein